MGRYALFEASGSTFLCQDLRAKRFFDIRDNRTGEFDGKSLHFGDKTLRAKIVWRGQWPRGAMSLEAAEAVIRLRLQEERKPRYIDRRAKYAR